MSNSIDQVSPSANVPTQAALDVRLSQLFNKKPERIKPGLERMREAAALDTSLQSDTPCILIAGTNGKGSTSAFLWKMLSSMGLRAGLFTSPHLIDLAERIQVSDRQIDNQQILDQVDKISRELPHDLFARLSFFECLTIAAARIFAQEQTDINIYEVGLGGRWDSTNIFEPFSTAIVSIGYDHQEFLGTTLAEILDEKLGICRPSVPLFWGNMGAVRDQQEFRRRVRKHGTNLGFPVHERSYEFGVHSSSEQAFLRLRGIHMDYPLPNLAALRPAHMKENFSLAVTLFADFLQRRLQLPELTLKKAIHNAAQDLAKSPEPLSSHFFGRFQVCQQPDQSSLILDVCHNIDGCEALIKTLWDTGFCKEGQRIPGLATFMRDKELNEMIAILRQCLDPIILFGLPDQPRTFSPDQLGQRNRNLPYFPTFRQALASIKLELNPSQVVVCGSCYGVGEALKVLK